MSRTSWFAIGLALTACQCESAPTSTPRSAISQVEAPPVERELRQHMQSHFAGAAELQAAIAQGRLADARDKAMWFASHDMDPRPAWSPYIQSMRDAATEIARAPDVPTAGAQIGRLGRVCSSCHQTERANLAFASEPLPASSDTLDAQMQRHQWAAARLWEGVIGPADQRWLDGARAMADARFDVAKSAHAKPNADVVELAERIREQAKAAITITDPTARASHFGAMMATCASCHGIARPAPRLSSTTE